MENFLKLTLSQLNNFWKSMDGASRRRIILTAVTLLAVAGLVTWQITKPNYKVLYSDLNSKEAGEILQKLEEMKVDAKPEGTGTIKVPSRDEAKIRMELAAEGYPKSGFNNYDLTTGGTGFGATDYDKKKADRYQLQDRLQSAIKTIDGVQDAVVTISIPDQDNFVLKDDMQPTTASVLLNLGSNILTAKQINGIQELVAKSVVGLKPENISIVDNNMNSLNTNLNSGSGEVSEQLDLEKQVKDSLQRQVLTLLEPVFGKSNVVASASMHLNFDKRVTNSVKFEPYTDSDGIAVSVNELKEEVSNGSSPDASGQTEYGVSGGSGQGNYSKSDKTINYEINKINDQLEEAQGKVTNLKLSVLINKSSLSAKTLSSVQKLVANAIGVDLGSVVVQGMAFDGAKAEQDKMDNLQKENNKKAVWNLVLEILKYAGLGVLLFFIMFLLYKLVTGIKISPVQNMEQAEMKQTAIFDNNLGEMPIEDREQMMKKQRIDNLVDSKPDVVAQQVRDWLNEN